MVINFRSLLCAISDALDYVEKSMFGAKANHAKRVAFMSACIGKKAGLSDSEIADLCACALLHDNALAEYISDEQQAGINVLVNKEAGNLGEHCVLGEDNVSSMPMYPRIKNVILYHHERPDGQGPFGRKTEDTPFYAQIIHLADLADIGFAGEKYNGRREQAVRAFVDKYRCTQFECRVAELFESCIDEGLINRLETKDAASLLKESFPEKSKEYTNDEVIRLASIFAHIVDYKSPFTRTHSIGIAQKALAMAEYYGWPEEKQSEYYLAGALHDIGKLAVETDILEKPAKLTDDEYKKIQFHAFATWEMLRTIEGFENITEWASYHHEKLDGTGYPFGKKADELGMESRLMACLDIYQALTEDRPYRKGMSSEEAFAFLDKQAALGKLDSDCIRDMKKALARRG